MLFKNIQRTWDERQKINNVKITNSFTEAVAGSVNWEYYFNQAKAQYLGNPSENVDMVVLVIHMCIPIGTWVMGNFISMTELGLIIILIIHRILEPLG